ncbi:hypothetical protein [Marivivens aquimaris]
MSMIWVELDDGRYVEARTETWKFRPSRSGNIAKR